jgi:hypothetical protein
MPPPEGPCILCGKITNIYIMGILERDVFWCDRQACGPELLGKLLAHLVRAGQQRFSHGDPDRESPWLDFDDFKNALATFERGFWPSAAWHLADCWGEDWFARLEARSSAVGLGNSAENPASSADS